MRSESSIRIYSPHVEKNVLPKGEYVVMMLYICCVSNLMAFTPFYILSADSYREQYDNINLFSQTISHHWSKGSRIKLILKHLFQDGITSEM